MRDLAALGLVIKELRAAKAKHPGWPSDQIHAAALMAEGAGETVQAAIDYHYNGGSLEDIRREAAHTAATAFRLLMALPEARS